MFRGRSGFGDDLSGSTLLPFAIPQRQSIEKFNEWIKTRWFAPTDLKQFANLGQLSGVYLPYWTYDSMTYTHYTGQRGDDYWDTETYTTTRENGRTVIKICAGGAEDAVDVCFGGGGSFF